MTSGLECDSIEPMETIHTNMVMSEITDSNMKLRTKKGSVL